MQKAALVGTLLTGVACGACVMGYPVPAVAEGGGNGGGGNIEKPWLRLEPQEGTGCSSCNDEPGREQIVVSGGNSRIGYGADSLARSVEGCAVIPLKQDPVATPASARAADLQAR